MRRTPIQKRSSLKRGNGFLKKSGRINPVSDKEHERQRIYREKQLEDEKNVEMQCAICSSQQSLSRHHCNSRRDILDYIYLCLTCHDKVHSDPKWARENGWLS